MIMLFFKSSGQAELLTVLLVSRWVGQYLYSRQKDIHARY